ncbi:MAG: MFS transporter [Actinobacteria bacterium]|nr:MFS transporter [Actinomycetota bacterium]
MSPRTQTQSATRARNGLWLAFGVMGIVAMAWIPRIPEITDSLELSNGEFGLLLMGSTFGSLFGAQLAGRMIHTFGSRRVAVIAATGMPLGLIAMGLSTSAPQLLAALVFMGWGYSSLDIAINTQAVAVEKLLTRRMLSGFHGMWSLGAFVTTLFGGILAQITTPRFNLVLVGVVSLFLYIPAIASLLGSDLDDHDGGGNETAPKVGLTGKSALTLWGLGLGLLGCLVAEGSIGDWSGLLLRDHMGIGKGVNASAFACFALAMIISRFLGDRVLGHFGPARTVRLGGFIGGSALGISIAIAVPLSSHWQSAALVVIDLGFFIAGLGMGPIFPAYILAASAVPGVAPSVAIARVGVISMAAFFIGPSITGGLAEVTSLPIAMALPVAMFLFSGFQSRAIRKNTSPTK